MKRERSGLRTLRKRIAEDELIIYLQAGMKHTKKDQEVDWFHVRYLKNQVNSHVGRLATVLYSIVQYCKDQERMAANLISGQDLPDMSLLVKDLKCGLLNLENQSR